MKQNSQSQEVKYKLNPELKRKTIITAFGETEYLSNCKLIDGKYYTIGTECVLVEKRWYIVTNPKIFFDCDDNTWKIKGFKIIKNGVVKFDENMKPVFGTFSENKLKNCRIAMIGSNGSKFVTDCMDFNIPKLLGFKEHINDNLWISEDYLNIKCNVPNLLSRYTSSNITRIIHNANTDFNYNKKTAYRFPNNAYNAEDSSDFTEAVKIYEKYNPVIQKNCRKLSRFLGDTTFGCEIETKVGNLPSYIQSQLGVIICKDGSIGYTPEFVTVPYKGAKGVQSLKNLFEELNNRCKLDYTCSLHYHFGNIRKDREFLVAIWVLYSSIQNDLHKMLPYYKTDPRGVKEKNYCAFLDKSVVLSTLSLKGVDYNTKIKSSSNNIQRWVLEGYLADKKYNRKNKKHPNGTQKWQIHSRYASLNFVNMFNSERQTLEFRAHHGVLEPNRAINWLLICNAIIKYAELHSSRIINNPSYNYTIEEVLNYYKNDVKTLYACKVSDYLNEYYVDRCKFFKKLKVLGDEACEKDYNDTTYSLPGAAIQSLL